MITKINEIQSFVDDSTNIILQSFKNVDKKICGATMSGLAVNLCSIALAGLKKEHREEMMQSFSNLVREQVLEIDKKVGEYK